MTRSWDTDFRDAMRETETGPIYLVEIETKDVGEPWLYLTNHDVDVDFPASGGHTYQVWPFALAEQTVAVDEDSAPQIRIADVYDSVASSWIIDTWLDSTDFRFHTVRIFEVQRDELDSAAKARVDAYKIVNIVRDGRVVMVELTTFQGMLSRMKMPSGILLRSEFPGIVRAQGVAG